MKDSPNLDLLRTIAVGLVVLSHFGLNLGWGHGFDIELVGRVGVAMFFVHTALVLMMSLERQGGAAGPFFLRRLLRIYPLSTAIVVLLAAGAWFSGAAVDRWMVLSNLLLIQNLTGEPSILGPLWSLPYEVQMYLLLPAMFAWTRVDAARRVMLIVAGAIVLLTAAQALAWNWPLVRFLPCFLAGVLAYVLPPRRAHSPMLLLAVVAAGAFGIPALAVAGVPELPLLWGLCLALGFTIPACREIASVPMARAARAIATHSYSVYLTHLFALAFALGAVPEAGPAVALGVFLCAQFALARVGYRWIEKPGIALGQRLANRWPRRSISSTHRAAIRMAPWPVQEKSPTAHPQVPDSIQVEA